LARWETSKIQIIVFCAIIRALDAQRYWGYPSAVPKRAI